MFVRFACGETARDLLTMVAGRSLGRQFGWLWAAYAASSVGTWVGFGAFPLIAILVLHSGPTAVSLMLATPLLLLRRDLVASQERASVPSDVTLTA